MNAIRYVGNSTSGCGEEPKTRKSCCKNRCKYSSGCSAAFEGPILIQIVRHFLEPPLIQNSDPSILDPDDTAALPFPKAFIDPLSCRSDQTAKFALR